MLLKQKKEWDMGYIKKNKKVILFYIVAVIMQSLIMYLGNVHTDIWVYCIVVISFIGLTMAVWDYSKYRKKIEDLKKEYLPVKFNSLEKSYIEIIMKLRNDMEKISSENKSKHNEMIDFYTMWVHQIKTPIAAMNLLLQDEEIIELPIHKELEGELFRIEQYVEMVLTYLRTENDTTDYLFERCNLEDIVKQSVRKYAKQFIRKQIKIELYNLDKVIVTDKKWIRFVIEQLLSNALKYTEHGSIKIYLNSAEEMIIEDTGIGIASDDLPRIFERGYTGYNGRMNNKSTGIGLYLCRNIMNKIGGSIRAESEINNGTRIILDIKNEKLEIE